MTRYQFESFPDRRKHYSVKWQQAENQSDLIPAWIADMDFPVLPEVRESIIAYADELVYGYSYPGQGLYEAIMDWEKEEHQYSFDQDALVFMEGVVPSLSTSIQAFTQEGDGVLINTPVYPPFAQSVLLNKRRLIRNPLLIKDGLFQIDFDLLETQLSQEEVKLYLFCNPHNPGGRVWAKDDLEKIGQLCQQYGVILVSDEIHQDLTLFGNQHHSFNTVDPSFKDFALVLSSATKTFNIAGTRNSFAIIENEDLRKAFKKQQLINNQDHVSTLGYRATEAAFRHGKAWLEELKTVLEANISYALERFAQEAPLIQVMPPQGTYLLWLDFSAYHLSEKEIFDRLKEVGLQLNPGSSFGTEGQFFARLNLACPPSYVEEIMDRLLRAF